MAQVQRFIKAATDLAQRHEIPVEMAKGRMLAARPDLRPQLEAALAAGADESGD